MRERLAEITEMADATTEADDAAAAFERAERAYRAAVQALDPTQPAEVERLDECRAAREQARNSYDQARADLSATAYAVTVDDGDDMTLKGRRDLIRAVVERVDVAPGYSPNRLTIVPK